ncbi:MAG: hypothetical protein PHZ27_04350 [Candidatus Omnitrophica bacterium]|nr:hypothetical protein [Candidatus Omnitrophota bacterium]
MIIEKNTQTENVDYKIYDIVEMENADGETVEVKKLRRTARQDEVEQRISQLDTEITRLQAEKKEEEEVLIEIKKLN